MKHIEDAPCARDRTIALAKRFASSLGHQPEFPPADLQSSLLAERVGASRLRSDVFDGRHPLETEARFKELVSAIREVFWILEVSSGQILYVSPAYEEIWGRSCEALYNDSQDWLAAVDEEDRERIAQLYGAEHRVPFEATFRIRRPDAELRWIRHRGFPIFDANNNVVRTAGIAADITEARLANQALVGTQRLLASIVNSSHDAIFSESPDGAITTWNPAAEDIFGYTAQEATGKLVDVLVPPEKEPEAEWIRAQTRRGLVVREFTTVRRHKDGCAIPVSLTVSPIRGESGNIIGCSTIASNISDRRALEEKLSTVEAQLRVVLESTGEFVLVLDRDWRLTYINRLRTGELAADVIGTSLWDYEPQLLGTRFEVEYRKAMDERVPRRFEDYFAALKVWLSCMAYPTATGLLILAQDVTEKHKLDEQLRSAQKMESIGQLAAGVAHEINTPIQYVGDNTIFLKESWGKISGVLDLAKRMRNELATRQHQSPTSAEFDARVQSADLDYLSAEIPKAIEQAIEGIGRVAKIVRAMKEFSHPGSEQKRAVNLNKAIEATVTIARNEWKYVADMELHFDPNLPLVPCLAGEINQVLLNLIVNAAQAIAEAQRAGAGIRGTIEITTLHDGDWVEVQIRDTGAGIPDNVRDKIFDPFFTTKPVGKGTGQGLTMAQTVVVKKHAGRIWFETERGRGTTFFVRLPLTPPDSSRQAQ